MKAKQVQRSSKKGQFSLQAILSIVVGLIVMIVVALPLINDTVSDATDQTDVTNENINATNGTTQTLANADGNDLVTDSETIFDDGTTLTKGDNYTTDDSAMTITFTSVNNTAFNATNAQINYTFQDEAFIDNATTRTVLDVLPIFVAIGALILGAAFVFRR